MTGEIVKKDGDMLTVKSKNFGLITMKWEDVATITADEPVTVVLSDRVVKGTIQGRDEGLVVSAPETPKPVPTSDIVALRNEDEQKRYERFLRPGFLDLWTVTGALNIAGSKGNADTSTLTTPFTFIRSSNSSRASAYFNSIRSTATVAGIEAQTARAIRGGWAYNRNLTKKIFWNLFNDYEYDRFQSLDLRVVLGSGLGYKIWTTETSHLEFVAGGAWNREKFDPLAPALPFVRNAGEAYWGNDLLLRVNSRTSLTQSFRMFNNISNTGEYRINFDIGATTLVTKWLTWTISFSDRLLSNPLPGRQSNDFLYSTGFGFSFSR